MSYAHRTLLDFINSTIFLSNRLLVFYKTTIYHVHSCVINLLRTIAHDTVIKMSTDNETGRASILEEKHLISILLYLKHEGLTRKIDLYNNVSFNPRMPEKIDRLEAAGLLEQKTDGYSRSTLLRLTEKGDKVAKLLDDIDQMLKA